jgi:hypothetical protein
MITSALRRKFYNATAASEKYNPLSCISQAFRLRRRTAVIRIWSCEVTGGPLITAKGAVARPCQHLLALCVLLPSTPATQPPALRAAISRRPTCTQRPRRSHTTSTPTRTQRPAPLTALSRTARTHRRTSPVRTRRAPSAPPISEGGRQASVSLPPHPRLVRRAREFGELARLRPPRPRAGPWPAGCGPPRSP